VARKKKEWKKSQERQKKKRSRRAADLPAQKEHIFSQKGRWRDEQKAHEKFWILTSEGFARFLTPNNESMWDLQRVVGETGIFGNVSLIFFYFLRDELNLQKVLNE